MSNSSADQNVVKVAIKIAHVLNKHVLENCSHCEKLFKEVFSNED
jgi:hypothetical protein